MRKVFATICLVTVAGSALAEGHLTISNAWIRTAPPGAMMLAGYASLKNDGDAPLVVAGAESAAFGSVGLHQTIDENGLAKMRPLGKFTIAPGETVVFSPGGKHFMLMQPKRELKPGDAAKIHVTTASGNGADAEFSVRDGDS